MSRTNFSESFQVLVHLKVLELFIESVLRYGLPAHYIGFFVKVGALHMSSHDMHSCRGSIARAKDNEANTGDIAVTTRIPRRSCEPGQVQGQEVWRWGY